MQLCDERQHGYNNCLRRCISIHSVPPLTLTPSPLHPLSFVALRNPRAHTAPGDVTRGVALRAIPKKKAKGNEESVWNELQVLQGLGHPYIVRPFSPHLFSPSHVCVRLLMRLVVFSVG